MQPAKNADRWTGRKINRQVCRQMDWQKDKQTNMQIDGLAER